MSSIGATYGFDWRLLWNLPENQGLKQLRKNPNVLFPGDEVFIPDLTVRADECGTDMLHKFELVGVPETLRIRLLDELDRPRANLKYELVIGGRSLQGKTNANGELEEKIPPLENNARLYVGEERREVLLSIGSLDPLDEVSGAQARLANLGYDAGPTDGVLGPRTGRAIRDFQDDYDLEITGELDPPTLSKLKDRHGH